MLKIIQYSVAVTAVFLLTGCATIAKNQMRQKKLANGSTINIDHIQPTAKWQCKRVASHSFTWKQREQRHFKNLMKPSEEILENLAVDYANKNHLKANYIYLQTRSNVSVGGFNVNEFKRNFATYYSCRYLNPDNKVYSKKSFYVG